MNNLNRIYSYETISPGEIDTNKINQRLKKVCIVIAGLITACTADNAVIDNSQHDDIQDSGLDDEVNLEAATDASLDSSDDASIDSANEAPLTDVTGEDHDFDTSQDGEIDVYRDAFYPWDAPDISTGSCDLYQAGSHNSPTSVSMGLLDVEPCEVTGRLTGGFYPAFGPSVSNSWATQLANFDLEINDPSTTYFPAVIVYTGRDSINFDIGDYELDIHSVDTDKLRTRLCTLECEQGAIDFNSCQQVRSWAESGDPLEQNEIFAPFTHKYISNVAKCTFDLPGGIDCSKYIAPQLFTLTTHTSSYSETFPCEVKMSVAIIGCN